MPQVKRVRYDASQMGEDTPHMIGIGDPVVHHMKERIAQRAHAAPCTIDLTQALVAYPPPLAPPDLDLADPAIHKLGPVQGDPMLRERIAEYRAGAFDALISAANVIVTAGANQAFALAMIGLAKPGYDVILPSPYFFNHAMTVRARGAKVIDVPVTVPSFQPDISAVQAIWTPQTAALVVTDPGNPTGMNLTANNRLRLQDAVRERHGWLIVDETYFEFQYEPRSIAPPLSVANAIVIGSFSKSLSLSGWRVGYLIGPESTVEQLLSVQDCIMIAAPTAAQALVVHALGRRREHLAALLPKLRASKGRLERALRACALIDAVYGEAAVFLWARVANDRPASTVVDYLLDELGIAVVAGDSFGAPGHLRVAYGTVTDAELDDLEQRLLGARPLG
jgi:aspartate/methionine/tyrosine aminotransferase